MAAETRPQYTMISGWPRGYLSFSCIAAAGYTALIIFILLHRLEPLQALWVTKYTSSLSSISFQLAVLTLHIPQNEEALGQQHHAVTPGPSRRAARRTPLYYTS